MKDVRTFYAKERKVNFYADRLCFSSKYMATIIKEVSGRNPSDWIRDYVLLNAKAMLNSGEYSVQQVADLLNFPNPSFFGKYFRLYVGCTPKEYLNRKRILSVMKKRTQQELSVLPENVNTKSIYCVLFAYLLPVLFLPQERGMILR